MSDCITQNVKSNVDLAWLIQGINVGNFCRLTFLMSAVSPQYHKGHETTKRWQVKEKLKLKCPDKMSSHPLEDIFSFDVLIILVKWTIYHINFKSPHFLLTGLHLKTAKHHQHRKVSSSIYCERHWVDFNTIDHFIQYTLKWLWINITNKHFPVYVFAQYVYKLLLSTLLSPTTER